MVVAGQVSGRDDDDWNRPPGLVAAELGDELEAVHLRHHQVEQDDARRDVAQALERHLSVLRLHDRVALRLEHAPEELPEPGVVVHDEHRAVAPVLLQHRHQAVAVDRLGEIVGGAESVAQVPVVDDRQHDDGNVGDI